ncbi:MAG: septum site-determining protein MinC [Candidatus Gastranaerophilales bacterium]|nr:septum site-determining protein MinC [Candidatus Gastranaerophilales bacterium]
MEKKGFIEDGFIIDLGDAKDAAEIIYELSRILEMPDTKDKRICLKLGSINLTQSQLLSIKSLISSMDLELAFVDTSSEQTELSALNLGIIVSELTNEIEIQDLSIEECKIKEIEVGKPKDGLSYELIETESVEEEKIEVIEKTEEELEAEEKLEELIDDENDRLTDKEVANYEISKLPTLYLQQTLRSGQTMSYDGNIVLIGDVKPGSEIIAKGDITIWGVLGGIAHAGARGNDSAKIRALKINAIQLRISGFYARRPDSMNIPFIQRSSEFTPEEARVNNGEIAVYKVNEGL